VKYILLFVGLSFSTHAFAVSECTGRTPDGTWVTVHINTTGAMGAPDQGEVSFEKEETKFGYRFSREDITQFFEYDEPSNNTAMIGLAAYVAKESPVAIKYNGPNFVDMDLKTVLDQNQTKDIKGNFLRVWKGPGHSSDDQVQILTIACSTWANI